ncbi:hypothetical protein [Micromonospora qiuiae]|nr:hypothetical protein [Micromonospora qiuiae]
MNAYRDGHLIDTTRGARPMSFVRRFDHLGITVARYHADPKAASQA